MIINNDFLATTNSILSSRGAVRGIQKNFDLINVPEKNKKTWTPRTAPRGDSIRVFIALSVFFLILPLSSVYADDQISFIDILKNLKLSSDSVFTLTTAISYGLGFWFMIAALIDLKHHGQSGGSTSSMSGMSGPLIKFFIGVALIYLPSTMNSIVTTFWGEEGILSYDDKGDGVLETFKTTAITIVRLIGLVSFINGFMVLSHSSDQGAQAGSVAKGIFRVFSGILAINVVATIKILETTFGITIL